MLCAHLQPSSVARLPTKISVGAHLGHVPLHGALGVSRGAGLLYYCCVNYCCGKARRQSGMRAPMFAGTDQNRDLHYLGWGELPMS